MIMNTSCGHLNVRKPSMKCVSSNTKIIHASNGAIQRHQNTTSSAKKFKFKNAKLFLDLKGFVEQEKLEADITSLGATIEKFLSREVTCVVTNRLHESSDAKNTMLLDSKASPALSR